MSDARPKLAAIHDKDNARPLGVVGWRSEYHAMRTAVDAVLALLPEHGDGDQNPYEVDAYDYDSAKDAIEEAADRAWDAGARSLADVLRDAITEHIDIAREHAWINGTPCSLAATHDGPHVTWNGYQWNDDGSPVAGGAITEHIDVEPPR